jgi:Xaa-Pro aminopeptidase
MNPIRKGMLQRIIENHDVGALIFWRPDELVMLLGYMPLWGLSFLVCTIDGEAVLFVPEAEPKDLLPADVPIETYPWGDINCTDPWEVLYKKMQSLLKSKLLNKRPLSFIRFIGRTAPCMMSGEQPPLPDDLLLRLQTVHEGGFIDLSKELLALYLYKTPEDVASLRLTHRVATEAVDAFYKMMVPGMTEADVANNIEAAVQQATETDSIWFAKAWPMVQSGINTCFAGQFNRTSGKKLVAGEMALVEMGICVNGYWADITRTAAIGDSTNTLEDVFYTVLEAQEKAMLVMRAGISMAEVDAVSRAYISKAGWGHLYNHGLGHQVGFRYHDPGDTLSPGSKGILEEGMVMTVEPGIYGPEIGGGVRIEENVLITAQGYEVLSDYPRALQGKY